MSLESVPGTEEYALLAPSAQSLAASPVLPVVADEPIPAVALPRYRFLPWLGDQESKLDTFSYLVIAAIVVGLFCFAAFSFWAPAHGGVDQNGYLVGGRQFAKSLSTRFEPQSPYEYVGNMWVMGKKDADGVAYYPKYPLGMSIVYAICLWVSKAHGTTLAFMVSPIAMSIAVAGVFFLSRALAGSFAAVLAMIGFATSQITLELMNNPNSHALCVACVVWGMFLTLRWWQTHSLWRGLLGGFLIGVAFTVRYTEGLLVLPLGLAIVTSIYWKNWRSYLWSAVPMFGWLLPVIYQLAFNKIAMGSWTGYDTTNESSAFTWQKFVDSWEDVIRLFDEKALTFTLAIGMVGMVLAYWRNWRIGLWLTLWFLPGAALYASYYWPAEANISLGYARFFLTVLPPLLIGAAVCVRFAIVGDGLPARRLAGGRVAAGFVIGAAALLSTYRAANGMQDSEIQPREALGTLQLSEQGLALAGTHLKDLPPGSVVFADEPRMADGLINYIQFLGDWHVYSIETFSGSLRRAWLNQNADPNNPNPLQQRRKDFMHKLYDGKDENSLQAEEQKIVKAAFAAQEHVYVLAPPATVLTYQPKYFPSSQYTMKTLSTWRDPVAPDMGKLPDPNAPPDQRRGGFGGGGGGRGRNRGGPGGPGGPGGGGFGGPGPRGGFNDFTASSWQLVEVTPRLPDVPAASAALTATTKPAAAAH